MSQSTYYKLCTPTLQYYQQFTRAYHIITIILTTAGSYVVQTHVHMCLYETLRHVIHHSEWAEVEMLAD